MKKFIKQNKLAFLISLFLFIIPFFWFKYGEVDYGGDSTRFYFYDPGSWLKNVALFYVNPLISLGYEMANFSMIPFLSFLLIAKKLLFNSPWWLNNFFNGLLLSGSFLSIYLISRELLKVGEEDGDEGEKKLIGPSILAGLFFISSPLLIYSWERALYSIHQILVYPLVFLLFLKYLNTGRYRFLAWLPIVFFAFSVNFSFGTAPWSLAFFLFTFPFLFFYCLVLTRIKRFLKGAVIFFVLFFLTLAFDIIPQIFNILSPSSINYQLVFNESGGMINRGLAYFLSIFSYVRLAYNFTSQDQYVISQGFGSPFYKMIFDYGVKFFPLYFLYPIILCAGLLVKKRHSSVLKLKISNLLLIFFLIILFFMTANITNFGVNLYKNLFYLPGFSMFRSFYGKFAMVYIFFFSLLLAEGMKNVTGFLGTNLKKILLYLFVLVLIIFNGWPLFTGRLVNGVLWRSENIPFTSQVDPLYEEFVARLKKEERDYKVLGLPLTNESYQILKGKTEGVYFGPSTISFLAGKNIFAGQGGFSVFWPNIQKLIEKKDYQQLNRVFSLLGIGYLFLNSDNYVYDNFPNYPYSDWFKQQFIDQKSVRTLAENLGYQKLFSYGPYSLYLGSNLLPHFFIPEKLVYSSSSNIDSVFEALSLEKDNPRLAVLQPFDRKFGSEIFEKVNKSFIYGISKDVDYLTMKNEIESDGVNYLPVVNKTGLVWWKKVVSEIIDEWTDRGNFLRYLNRKLMHANNRVFEARDFKGNEVNKLIIYCRKIKDIFNIIKNVEDNDLKVRIVYMLQNNLRDNLARLEKNPPKNYADWFDKISNFQDQFKELLPQFNFFERIYEIDVPEDNVYEIFLGNLDKEFFEEGVVDNISLKIDGEEIALGAGEVRVFASDYFKWSTVWLPKGKRSLTISFKKIPDLLSGSQIESWDPGQWYSVRGDVHSDGSGGLTLEETYKALPETIGGEESLKVRQLRKIDLKQGKNSVEFEVKAHPKAISSSFIYPRDFDKGQAVLRVEKIVAPKVLLTSVEKEKDSDFPTITFTKINPVKYLIKVAGIRSDFGLVFSEGYNAGWNLYLREKNTSDLQAKHYLVNGYANMWYIASEDIRKKNEAEFILEFWPQRLFYIGSFITIVVLMADVLFLLKSSLGGEKNEGKNY